MTHRLISRMALVAVMCGLAVSVLLAIIFLVVIRGHMSPAQFDFVRLGETTPQVTKTRGEPWLAYRTSIFDGEIDPFISLDEPEHYAWPILQSRRTGKKLVTVYGMEYRNPSYTAEYAKLVFRDRKVYYALLPTRIWERSSAGLKLRYGRKLTVQRIPVQEFDVRYTAELWSDPAWVPPISARLGQCLRRRLYFRRK
jgi:hypothetical protein